MTMERAQSLRTRRRARQRDGHVSHERWLVSYADFITLLFAFFTMMYGMSTVDAKKFRAVAQAMQIAFEREAPGALGRIGVGDPMQPNDGGDGLLPGARGFGPGSGDALAMLEREISARLGAAIALHQVSVQRDARGLVISIREAGSFQTGRADLSPTAIDVLNEIGAAIAGSDHPIRVEGHTDDVPIRTDRFASNWELSTARATNVIAHLVSTGAGPQRLSAAGYAEFHPYVPNDSEAHRASNRRVDIVILSAPTARREEPRAPMTQIDQSRR